MEGLLVLAEVREDLALFRKGHGVGAVELDGPVAGVQRFPVLLQPDQHRGVLIVQPGALRHEL